jgi:FkbM family methyltransferase
MIKDLIRTAGQKLLGFNNYLFVFAVLNIFRMRAGLYEKEFRYFMEIIPAGGAILDIGANIGIMTVALAKKYPGTTILAFEPMPGNIGALQKITRFYNTTNVKILRVALGDRNEKVQMIMPFSHHAKMQGLSHVLVAGEAKQAGELFFVQMQKMDDVKELDGLEKISAIKIDVENFELYVLRGGEAVLRKHRPLVYCELWNDEKRAQCIHLVAGLGYKIMVFSQGALVDYTGQPSINFFFLP